MRAHAEAVGDRLETFLLLVDAVARAPPPRLMDERPMRGIHEANDAVIDVHGHLGLQVGGRKLVAEFFDLRRGFGRFLRLAEPCARRPRIRNVDPDKPILLLTWIAARVNALNL